MGRSAEELAQQEMESLLSLMKRTAPQPQFTDTGAGPYFEPSAEFKEYAALLKPLRVLYPKQWEAIPAEKRAVATTPRMSLEGLHSLPLSLGSPIGVAPQTTTVTEATDA